MNMKKIFLLVTLILAFAANANSQELPGEKFKPLPEHQTCTSDNDCISFGSECAACACCQPLNKTYLEDYKDILGDELQGLEGGECDWDCPAYAACEEGICKFSQFLPEDQACESPGDCIFTWSRCDYCECGTPMNRKHLKKYEDLRKEKCPDPMRGICDMFCPEPYLDCQENKCVSSETDPKDREVEEK